MNPTTEALIADGINAALPAVMAFVHGHFAANNQPPTVAQVRDYLARDTTGAVGIDTAWLRAHGLSVPPAAAAPTA